MKHESAATPPPSTPLALLPGGEHNVLPTVPPAAPVVVPTPAVAAPTTATPVVQQAVASVASAPAPQPAGGDMPKVKDALSYLQKVKVKFGDRPNVYNQFLEIMKEFKAQTINTEGVIKRVTTLFHGHRELILGFNQFLPPGYKIVEPPTTAPAPKPTVEFNHAVKYVAKIKQRFVQKPDVYEDFLEILHAYQEKRSTDGAIEQVKAQVQHLFRGHPDLLDDFNYFLPADSGAWPVKKPPKEKKKKKSTEKVSRKLPDEGPDQQVDQVDVLPPPSSLPHPAASAAGRRSVATLEANSVPLPPDSKKELQFFEKIKTTVPKSLYVQFLRCLNLYSNNLVSRAELVTLIEDLFNTFPKFADFSAKFKDMIGYNEWEENQLMTHLRSNFYAFVSSVDFTTCEQVTPSYRELPKEVPVPPCSGRTVLGDAVLNDTCISIPTGTEDQSFKSSRKNQYEEALFRVEDERYELDMMIENNAAAIRVMQPVADKIEVMTYQQAAEFKFDHTVDVLHIRAMSRLYGDQWYDIVRLLKRNPATAVPIILKRLKQKDVEWRKVRLSMRKPWRDIVRQNYHRSLDHRSFQFKSEDKKLLSSKSLIAELKEDHEKAFGMDQEQPDKVAEPSGLEMLPANRKTTTLYTYCMTFPFKDNEVHHEIYSLVQKCTDHIAHDEREKLLSFWTNFVQDIFCVTSAATSRQDATMDTSEESPTMSHESSTPKLSTKPLNVMLETWSQNEKVNPVRRHSRPSKLFFGNMSFYVFFRLHQFLYSRWNKCRDLALAKKDGVSVYEAFKVLVHQLLDSEIDQVSFEDQVRELVGAGSYQIFTIDRLVSHLVKQMQILVSSVVNQNLVKLYSYELPRSRDVTNERSAERSAQLARMYLSNYAAVVVDDHNCMQMEFFEDTRELGIGFVETLVPLQPKPTDDAASEYVAEFLDAPVQVGARGDTTRTKDFRWPFLPRNVERFRARVTEPLRHVRRCNGLESKVCIRTCKMHYIEGTEDTFCRRRPPPPQPEVIKRVRQARAESMRRWWRQQAAATSDPRMCVRFSNDSERHQEQEVQQEQEPAAQQRHDTANVAADATAEPTPPTMQRDAPQATISAAPMDLS